MNEAFDPPGKRVDSTSEGVSPTSEALQPTGKALERAMKAVGSTNEELSPMRKELHATIDPAHSDLDQLNKYAVERYILLPPDRRPQRAETLACSNEHIFRVLPKLDHVRVYDALFVQVQP
jgi:hypothetical protein